MPSPPPRGNRAHVLADDRLGRLLFSMSAPAIVGMLVMALYNIVDTMFVGHKVGPLAIGALVVAFPIQMLVMSVGMAFGLGGASVVSRALGAGRPEAARRAFGNVVASVLAMSATAAFTGYIWLDEVLRLFGATPDILPYARQYMGVILPCTFFFAFVMSTNNIVRAVGKARMAMLVMIVPAVINVILDWVFIYGMNLDVTGAALATVCAQASVALWLTQYILRVPGPLHLSLADLRFEPPILREILSIGFSGFVHGSASSLVLGFLIRTVGHYGTALDVAAFGIINRLLRLAFMPVLGLTKGLQPIAGFNYGALRYDKAYRVIRLALFSSTTIALLGGIALFAVPQLWFRLFTQDVELIRRGSGALRIMVIGLPFMGIHLVTPTVFRALGRAWPSLILSMTRWILVLLPLIWLLPMHFGLSGVWISYPLSDATAALVAAFFLKYQMRILREREEEKRPTHVESRRSVEPKEGDANASDGLGGARTSRSVAG